jgi:hypothetical protein
MFDRDTFIQDCIRAVAEGQEAVREIVAKAMSDSANIMLQLGEPEHAGMVPLYRANDLTIINFRWAPCMTEVSGF